MADCINSKVVFGGITELSEVKVGMKNSETELKCFAPWLEMILSGFIWRCKVAGRF
jgi:hypothetical protein